VAWTGGDGMAEWWSIEVFSGDKLPASGWRYAYEDELTEAAITHGAMYYEWHDTEYGVIFEVLFSGDEQWEAFRALPAVRAALDGVPDPVEGLIIYRGRGGAAGSRTPRKPKPAPGAAALELEEPQDEKRLKFPRRLRYRGGGANWNDADWDEVRRELGIGAPGEDGPGADAPGTGAPGTEVPGAEPISRDIAAVDRSFD
jgi:hypothetical protein